MSTFVTDVRFAATELSFLSAYEPAVRLDLSQADILTLAAIMLINIGEGRNTASSIFRYLKRRKSPVDRPTVETFLRMHEGVDRRTCLWRRDKSGRYAALI